MCVAWHYPQRSCWSMSIIIVKQNVSVAEVSRSQKINHFISVEVSWAPNQKLAGSIGRSLSCSHSMGHTTREIWFYKWEVEPFWLHAPLSLSYHRSERDTVSKMCPEFNVRSFLCLLFLKWGCMLISCWWDTYCNTVPIKTLRCEVNTFGDNETIC